MTMPGHLATTVQLVVLYGVLVAVCLATTAHSQHHNSQSSSSSPKMLAAVESQLLRMLGLNSRPRPREVDAIHQIPDYMLQLYQTQRKQRRALADTVRSFNHQESPHDARYAKHKFRLLFNVTSVPSTDVLRVAELRVYRQNLTACAAPSDNTTVPSSSSSSSSNSRFLQRILVYDILRPSTPTDEAIHRLIDSRQVDIRHSGWENYDVFPAVVRWQKEPLANYGLYVHVQGSKACRVAQGQHVRLRRSSSSDNNDRTWHEQKPMLVVHSDDPKTASSSNSRQWRRSASEKKGQRRKAVARDNCRRHQLYVDFSDVGWNDWIVAPPGYQAYYCHGECNFPLADHLNSTNHAIVQTLMHSVKPHAVPRVCCVPTQLSSISMLYLDEYDKVVLKNYQDMVVQGCGCR